MNTILITGAAKTIANASRNGVSFKVEYDVAIWASKENEQIQAITFKKDTLCGHGDLWAMAKNKVEEYFNDPSFQDGAYTQYLDHLVII